MAGGFKTAQKYNNLYKKKITIRTIKSPKNSEVEAFLAVLFIGIIHYEQNTVLN